MFHEELRAARGALGLSQRAMAGQLGLSPSALGMYEQGRRVPGPKTAARMNAWLLPRGFALPPVPPTPEGPSGRFFYRGSLRGG